MPNSGEFMKYLLLLLLVISCGSSDKDTRGEAEKLFAEAQELVKAERFILATEKLNIIKSQHPYSFYATPAELLHAEILYKQENYIESAAAFMLFRDFHPRHEKIPYVILMIAESFYKQIPKTIDRDLSPAIEAINYYEEVMQRYPDSEDAEKAKKRIIEANNMLKSKDLYVADFYFKTKKWGAARYWYLDIIQNHHQDRKTAYRAAFRVVKASYNKKDYQECIEYGEKFQGAVDKKTSKDIKSVVAQCRKEFK